jgi:hypothetical protein
MHICFRYHQSLRVHHYRLRQPDRTLLHIFLTAWWLSDGRVGESKNKSSYGHTVTTTTLAVVSFQYAPRYVLGLGNLVMWGPGDCSLPVFGTVGELLG